MFNLFVSGRVDAWQGAPWNIDLGRSLTEYTDQDLTQKFGDFSEKTIVKLKRYPAIFAYEAGNEIDPKFGRIRRIRKLQQSIEIEYEILDVDPFLTYWQLAAISAELDLGRLELYRTHWALKDVNLARQLSRIGIDLPDWARRTEPPINIDTHQFDVALSFPGEERKFVEEIAKGLENLLGPDRYFYDFNYPGHLARPGLDLLLQDIYGNRSKLIVVFISGAYQAKDWCGIEFRAIRDIINRRENARIMLVRTGDGDVDGVRAADGYVDARRFAADQIAGFIADRAHAL